jgi:acyl transferase domain-containing protein
MSLRVSRESLRLTTTALRAGAADTGTSERLDVRGSSGRNGTAPAARERLSLAAVNSRSNCVVSGPDESAELLQKQLGERNIACRRLCTSHAFHSEMMDSILAPFSELVRQVKLNSPEIPIVSTLTGTWAEPADLTDPDYWARQLRQSAICRWSRRTG